MPRHKQSDPSTIRTSVIRLRVTEEEAKLFKSNAKKAGCKTLSEYIRMMCIEDHTASTSESGTSIIQSQCE